MCVATLSVTLFVTQRLSEKKLALIPTCRNTGLFQLRPKASTRGLVIKPWNNLHLFRKV